MTNGTRGRNESSVPAGDIFPRVTRPMIRLYRRGAHARTLHATFLSFFLSFFFFLRAPKGATAKGTALGNVGLVGTTLPLFPSILVVRESNEVGLGGAEPPVIARNFYRVIVGWKG